MILHSEHRAWNTERKKGGLFPSTDIMKSIWTFFWKWDFFHLLWVVFPTRLGFWQWCVHWSLDQYLPQTAHPISLPKAAFCHPVPGWCSGERSAKKIKRRARVVASCFNWWCFLSSWEVTLVWKDELSCEVRLCCGSLHLPELETPCRGSAIL